VFVVLGNCLPGVDGGGRCIVILFAWSGLWWSLYCYTVCLTGLWWSLYCDIVCLEWTVVVVVLGYCLPGVDSGGRCIAIRFTLTGL